MYNITQHLIEAIEINIQRMITYAKLSDGKSLIVSILLISSELIVLPTSFLIDVFSKYWQKRGIPLMVYEFISMKETPKFSPQFSTHSDVPKWRDFNFFVMQYEGFKAFLFGSHTELNQWLSIQIIKLNKYPHYFCMVRHILESLQRSNNLAIKHKRLAKKLNVISPGLICNPLIYTHLNVVFLTSILDRLAFSLQKSGLPIIYQDVPHIPVDELSYNV